MTTCPQRWEQFQRTRANFEALRLPFSLRFFQTQESLDMPRVNAALNARAALAYAHRHLPNRDDSWLLYLEDDIVLHQKLTDILPVLSEVGVKEGIDCWYLCNRKVTFDSVRCFDGFVGVRLVQPIAGAQALLISRRHIPRILKRCWTGLPDEEICGAINSAGGVVFQIVDPILVEHIGVRSTFDPHVLQKLEVNYANTPNCN